MEIRGYTIERELGRGGMSTVYLAVQQSLDRQVALKVMTPTLTHDQSFKDRFLREGRTVAKLNHPYIVTIYDIGLLDDYCFISMEYVADGDLSTRIKQGLSVERSVQIVKRVAKALAYAHQQGFVHRDLKPSNVLFRDDEYAVLADFGIAKSIHGDQTLTQAGLTPGTPTYMSPEQARGLSLDGRSDLYSLGVVFYEMLTGQRLFEADTGIATILKHLTEPPPDLPDEFSNLQPVLSKLLAKQPEDRFEDADDFIATLDSISGGTLTTSTQDPDKTILEPVATGFDPDATLFEKAWSLTRSRSESKARNLTALYDTFRSRKGLSLIAAGGAAMLAVILVVVLSTPEDDPVEQLLAKANEQFAASELIAPDGNNAYETYREVLALDPDNATALKGVESVTGEIEKQARARLEAGELQAGLALTDQGLSIQSDNKSLLSLRETLREQLVSEQNSATQQRRISALLEKSDEQLSKENFTAPENDNALNTLREVLRIDPENAKARQGLQAIASHYQKQAREAWKSGKAEPALAAVSQGLRALPENPDLLALKDEIQRQSRAQAAQETRQKELQLKAEQGPVRVKKLLEEARQHVAASRLTRPESNNALETYQRVLKLDPDNQDAKNGLDSIAVRYMDLARTRQQAGELSQGLQLAQRGLSVRPQHRGLQNVRSEIQKAMQGQSKDKGEIGRLLARAQSQVETLKLTQPPGDNAFETAQAILKLDPDNASAKKTLTQISTRYESLVRTRQLEGSIEAGLALAREGLKVDPKHAGLLKLKENLTQQLEQRRKTEPATAAEENKKSIRSFGTF